MLDQVGVFGLFLLIGIRLHYSLLIRPLPPPNHNMKAIVKPFIRPAAFHVNRFAYSSHLMGIDFLTGKANIRHDDTVYALSSGPMTKCGVSVIRMSGVKSKYCLEKLIEPVNSANKGKFPAPRIASLRKLYCPKTGEVLDRAIVIWFPAPNSFTGEDIVEYHVHGSRAVILGLFDAFEHLDDSSDVARGGIRPAERGEFTRMAFDNGKMDLTEVEGLADLLEADTSEQRKQALRQMDGHIRIVFESWR